MRWLAYEAVITQVTGDQETQTAEGTQTLQTIEVEITSGDRAGKTLTIQSNTIGDPNAPKFQTGDGVLIEIATGPDGQEQATIIEFIRSTPLYVLFFIFVAVTLLIARRRGLASLAGMAISFLITFQFVIPRILSGADPLLIAILAAAVIIPITFYLSHGLNRKTSAAIVGTLVSLVTTGILAVLFIQAAKLSGYGAEEATSLQQASADTLNIKGLLLAGIVIGLLGIFDDITVSQAAIVYQLKQASPAITFRELYARAMDIGRDHIASLVNTLVLVYAGAALPRLLLFTSGAVPFDQVINYEAVAEEIVRTLVASIGLILAVPITTLLTAFFVSGAPRPVRVSYPPPPPMPAGWRKS